MNHVKSIIAIIEDFEYESTHKSFIIEELLNMLTVEQQKQIHIRFSQKHSLPTDFVTNEKGWLLFTIE